MNLKPTTPKFLSEMEPEHRKIAEELIAKFNIFYLEGGWEISPYPTAMTSYGCWHKCDTLDSWENWTRKFDEKFLAELIEDFLLDVYSIRMEHEVVICAGCGEEPQEDILLLLKLVDM